MSHISRYLQYVYINYIVDPVAISAFILVIQYVCGVSALTA